jgi:hypothetical protein
MNRYQTRVPYFPDPAPVAGASRFLRTVRVWFIIEAHKLKEQIKDERKRWIKLNERK